MQYRGCQLLLLLLNFCIILLSLLLLNFCILFEFLHIINRMDGYLQRIGEEKTMLDSCRRKGAPKLSVVSCIVNAPMLQPYIFRNYVHPPGRESHFKGGCEHMLWQALQASAAAPGYFEEVS